ncbi:MAG: helix-turn-helix transcriptional regulator [Treponema sp.]
MMHAYSKLYLCDSQVNLASMFDFAIRGLNYSGDDFFSLFIDSGVASKFEHGNPKYVAGMSGRELADLVLKLSGHSVSVRSVPCEIDTTYDGPEYWLGWVMAYYQWYRSFRFSDLKQYGLIPSEILNRYILHEADISKFVETADEIIRHNQKTMPTRLKQIRTERKMTQKELSDLSGVSLRMIQLYEQRQNDINKAAGSVINRLAWVLKCNFYEIMELEF